MPCVSDFGIIDKFEKDRDYASNKLRKCSYTAVNDDILNDWWKGLTRVKTYFHCYDRPEFGIARHG